MLIAPDYTTPLSMELRPVNEQQIVVYLYMTVYEEYSNQPKQFE